VTTSGIHAGRLAAAALTRRELIRFVRQPTRVAASIGTPLLVWILLASGLGGSFAMPDVAAADVRYGGYLLPGVITMTILFSSIFAAISLMQDRQAGFLQAVLVSPTPGWAIAASKVMGGASIAGGQAAILLLAAPFVGLNTGILGVIAAIVASAITSVAIVGLSLAAAWWIDSTAGFHGVMNMVLMPMWLLSGALFPVQGASAWLATIVRANPLHWCHAAIAGSLGIPGGEGAAVSWGAMTLFALAMFGAAALMLGSRRARVQSGGIG
jgi:ABC-2 type transport system permease protein